MHAFSFRSRLAILRGRAREGLDGLAHVLDIEVRVDRRGQARIGVAYEVLGVNQAEAGPAQAGGERVAQRMEVELAALIDPRDLRLPTRAAACGRGVRRDRGRATLQEMGGSLPARKCAEKRALSGVSDRAPWCA